MTHIDGVASTATADANQVIASYVPPSDIVQEFKVQTATFDAQFGNTEGSVTSTSSNQELTAFTVRYTVFSSPASGLPMIRLARPAEIRVPVRTLIASAAT